MSENENAEIVEQRRCKKCGRILPDDYKHKKCESCRNKTIETWKNIGEGALGLGATLLAFVVPYLDFKNKDDN